MEQFVLFRLAVFLVFLFSMCILSITLNCKDYKSYRPVYKLMKELKYSIYVQSTGTGVLWIKTNAFTSEYLYPIKARDYGVFIYFRNLKIKSIFFIYKGSKIRILSNLFITYLDPYALYWRIKFVKVLKKKLDKFVL